MRPFLLFASALALSVVPMVGCSTERGPAERLARGDAPIIGGTVDNGHGYVVAVGDEFIGPWCSATLISRQTVLTAAHCALGITRVFFGTTLSSGVAEVDQEIIHPLYEEGDYDTPDIALVRLATPVTLQAAPLLRQTLQNTIEFVGPDWTWVGFGINDAMSQSGFGTRRVTTLPLAGVGPQLSPVPISEHYVSYVVGASSPCFGDSGGPAFHISAGVEHVGAVASWVGDDFCSTFGAHTRADETTLTTWLQAVIDAFEPGGACRNDGACNEACNVDGQIGDPDCHRDHCGDDDMCALACVAPVDPNCAGIGVDHCLADGVCDPSCNPPDPDCNMSSVVATTTQTTSTGMMNTSSLTSVTVGPGPGPGPGPGVGGGSSVAVTGGGGTANPGRFDRDNLLYGRGCAVVAAPRPSHGPMLAVLTALAIAARRRSRRACQGGER